MKNFPIKRIVVHCTATREGQAVNASTIQKWHKAKGWKDIGYHYIILLDGRIEKGRADNVVGSHVAGWNTGSLAIVYIGGLDKDGNPKDTRTAAQKLALKGLVTKLAAAHNVKRVIGHRDLSPDKDGDGIVEKNEWLKGCPCFDMPLWYQQGMPI